MAKLDGMQNLVLNGHGAAIINGLTSGATIDEVGSNGYQTWMTVNMGTAAVLNVNAIVGRSWW